MKNYIISLHFNLLVVTHMYLKLILLPLIIQDTRTVLVGHYSNIFSRGNIRYMHTFWDVMYKLWIHSVCQMLTVTNESFWFVFESNEYRVICFWSKQPSLFPLTIWVVNLWHHFTSVHESVSKYTRLQQWLGQWLCPVLIWVSGGGGGGGRKAERDGRRGGGERPLLWSTDQARPGSSCLGC